MAAPEELQRLMARIPDPADDGRYTNLDGDKVRQIEQVVDELARAAHPSALGLIDLLVEPGQGDDVKAHFALHLLAVRVTQKGNEKARAEFAEAVASQIGGERPKAVQAYLIEQLQLAGTKAVAPALGKVLLDPALCDTAARALVAMGEGAAEPLLAAWPKVQGRSRISVLQKLVGLRVPQAAEAFRQGLGDADPEVRTAAAWGLARLADASAATALLAAAESRQGWERMRQTDACMVLAEGLAAAGRKDEAAAIYEHLAKTRNDPAERHLRDAAAQALAALRKPAAAGAEEGFRPLFDGRSFAGWKTTSSTAKSWKIKASLLVLTGGSDHLFTEEKFEDFILRFEWRPLKPGDNSGVFVRGRQIQMAQGGAGMLFGTKEAKAVPELHNPPGQWNTWQVTCVGTKLSLEVNGRRAWAIDHFPPACVPLGIEAEGHPIEFRNLRIKTAGKAPP